MADRRVLQELHGENEDIVCNYVFECTSELANRGQDFTLVYEEFIDYKVRSDVTDELPAPSEDDQKDHECVNDLFGKDKPNAPHSSLSEEHSAAQIELSIYHLHTFDGSRPFHKWQVNKQWLNVCNKFVIYSFFEYSGAYYFYVLDLVEEKGTEEEPDGGHEALCDPDLVQQWIDDARAFKEAEQAVQSTS
ncbi:hypothetical protein CRN32_07580 [Vibrio vulnificus]|uniref:hypothetical protein n=1 Tax=Vibrio vulnificus TaxID=672 RepID=UPI000CD0757A|nr:hypothetical protein [Vibrio vulnificus]POC56201.1 hypothetical protein CRN32_07580 [Vibrio vulnificus]RZQ81786.1 hypothetical protein D8T27_24040 [Vibrio vulnificus]